MKYVEYTHVRIFPFPDESWFDVTKAEWKMGVFYKFVYQRIQYLNDKKVIYDSQK